MMKNSKRDPCTFSSYFFYKLQHLSIDWNVNFENKIINGKCNLTFQQNNKYADKQRVLVIKTFDS